MAKVKAQQRYFKQRQSVLLNHTLVEEWNKVKSPYKYLAVATLMRIALKIYLDKHNNDLSDLLRRAKLEDKGRTSEKRVFFFREENQILKQVAFGKVYPIQFFTILLKFAKLYQTDSEFVRLCKMENVRDVNHFIEVKIKKEWFKS